VNEPPGADPGGREGRRRAREEARGRQELAESPPPQAEECEVPSFARLGRWDWLAFAAALALMLTMSVDWYTTKEGEELRNIEQNSSSNEDIVPSTKERAAERAETLEKNAWQASAFLDRLILVALLAAFAAAAASAFLKAAARRFEPPWTPAGIAAIVGSVAALLIVYRMLIDQPGLDEAAVVKVGLPLSLIAVGVLAFAARQAALAEREG
jgi:hypothetical protein